ncbi:hypothetical protein V8G54_024800 [Vigna mungo]|uniref:Uncharacterized protein n=1 Tax=Vigna mungo TaxID=3915 RepID=A0AAQ3RTG9_VIGMU
MLLGTGFAETRGVYSRFRHRFIGVPDARHRSGSPVRLCHRYRVAALSPPLHCAHGASSRRKTQIATLRCCIAVAALRHCLAFALSRHPRCRRPLCPCRLWSEEQVVAVGSEKSQIYRSEGLASAPKDPSSIPNVSEAIASLSSTPKANSLREKRRCSFAPRVRRGQLSELQLLMLEEVTPIQLLCFLISLSVLLNSRNYFVGAVVTGANKGIGFAICKQLASNCFTVLLTAKDEKRGVEAVEKLKELGLPGHVVFHQLDVIDPICSV